MKRKIVTVCLAAVLVIIAVAGASLAYLTDTDERTNTFTVGDVDIHSLSREKVQTVLKAMAKEATNLSPASPMTGTPFRRS